MKKKAFWTFDENIAEYATFCDYFMCYFLSKYMYIYILIII